MEIRGIQFRKPPRPLGCRGRNGLAPLILKHVGNWSYQVLEREVRANLVYRDF